MSSQSARGRCQDDDNDATAKNLKTDVLTMHLTSMGRELRKRIAKDTSTTGTFRMNNVGNTVTVSKRNPVKTLNKKQLGSKQVSARHTIIKYKEARDDENKIMLNFLNSRGVKNPSRFTTSCAIDAVNFSHVCDSCKVVRFKTYSELRLHEDWCGSSASNSHCETIKLECDGCNRKYHNDAVLAKHTAVCKASKGNASANSGISAPINIYNFTTVYAPDCQAFPYSCTSCHIVMFKSNEEARRHEEWCGMVAGPRKDAFKCASCGLYFRNRLVWGRHQLDCDGRLKLGQDSVHPLVEMAGQKEGKIKIDSVDMPVSESLRLESGNSNAKIIDGAIHPLKSSRVETSSKSGACGVSIASTIATGQNKTLLHCFSKTNVEENCSQSSGNIQISNKTRSNVYQNRNQNLKSQLSGISRSSMRIAKRRKASRRLVVCLPAVQKYNGRNRVGQNDDTRKIGCKVSGGKFIAKRRSLVQSNSSTDVLTAGLAVSKQTRPADNNVQHAVKRIEKLAVRTPSLGSASVESISTAYERSPVIQSDETSLAAMPRSSASSESLTKYVQRRCEQARCHDCDTLFETRLMLAQHKRVCPKTFHRQVQYSHQTIDERTLGEVASAAAAAVLRQGLAINCVRAEKHTVDFDDSAVTPNTSTADIISTMKPNVYSSSSLKIIGVVSNVHSIRQDLTVVESRGKVSAVKGLDSSQISTQKDSVSNRDETSNKVLLNDREVMSDDMNLDYYRCMMLSECAVKTESGDFAIQSESTSDVINIMPDSECDCPTEKVISDNNGATVKTLQSDVECDECKTCSVNNNNSDAEMSHENISRETNAQSHEGISLNATCATEQNEDDIRSKNRELTDTGAFDEQSVVKREPGVDLPIPLQKMVSALTVNSTLRCCTLSEICVGKVKPVSLSKQGNSVTGPDPAKLPQLLMDTKLMQDIFRRNGGQRLRLQTSLVPGSDIFLVGTEECRDVGATEARVKLEETSARNMGPQESIHIQSEKAIVNKCINSSVVVIQDAASCSDTNTNRINVLNCTNAATLKKSSGGGSGKASQNTCSASCDSTEATIKKSVHSCSSTANSLSQSSAMAVEAVEEPSKEGVATTEQQQQFLLQTLHLVPTRSAATQPPTSEVGDKKRLPYFINLGVNSEHAKLLKRRALKHGEKSLTITRSSLRKNRMQKSCHKDFVDSSCIVDRSVLNTVKRQSLIHRKRNTTLPDAAFSDVKKCEKRFNTPCSKTTELSEKHRTPTFAVNKDVCRERDRMPSQCATGSSVGQAEESVDARERRVGRRCIRIVEPVDDETLKCVQCGCLLRSVQAIVRHSCDY